MDAGAGSSINPLQILFYILLVIGSAYFASAESAYARANKIRLKNIADEGNKKAKTALFVKNNFDKALTSILIGNNIMHLTCSSLATVAVAQIGLAGKYTVYATVITTVIIFLFGEMLPKAYANANCEKVAVAFSGSLSAIMKLLYPVAFLFLNISRLFSKLFGGGEDERMTEEDLETIIDDVEDSGVLDEEQSDLLQNAVEFTKTPVEDVMTMREDIFGIDVSMPAERVLETVKTTGFSRLPVYDGDLDRIIGILSVREYLRAYFKRGYVNLRRIVTQPKFAMADEAIDDLFSVMSRSKQQMVVVKEDGKTVGIATIEDFLEELVGEIWDEYDVYDENFIKLGGNYFEISPKMKLRDAFNRIGYPLPDISLQRKTLEAWLRANTDGELEKDTGFTYGRLAVMAGEMEDGNTLKSVIIRLCDDEDEAKEETEQ